MALHGRDWERLAAFGDQVGRSVGNLLPEHEERGGECGEDQCGAGDEDRGPGVTFELGDDGAGEGGSACEPLPGDPGDGFGRP